MEKKPLLTYFLLAFGICWAAAAIIYFTDIDYGSLTSTIIVAFLCMPAPAFGAWYTWTKVLKRPFSELNLTWKGANKSMLLTIPIWLLAWTGFYLLIVFVLGNVIAPDYFGSVDFSRDHLLNTIEDMSQGQFDPESFPLPSPLVLLSIVIFAGILAGSTVNLPFTLGEEIGWRGFMYTYYQDASVVKRVLITGFAWGLWHAPLILMGHNFPLNPVLGVFMMIAFCIVLSFPMDWIRRTSGSILGPAIFHGMINAVAGGIMLFIINGKELLSSLTGLSGLLAFIIVYLLQLSIHRTKNA